MSLDDTNQFTSSSKPNLPLVISESVFLNIYFSQHLLSILAVTGFSGGNVSKAILKVHAFHQTLILIATRLRPRNNRHL